MKIYYGDEDKAQLNISDDAIDDAIQYGILFSIATQVADKKYSYCWTHFFLWLNRYGFPQYCYGGNVKDVYFTLDKHEVSIGCFKIDNNYPLGYKKLK